jgi:hypothetical protein
MTRKLAAAFLWVCLHTPPPLLAQESTREIGLTLSRSIGASAAAHGQSCRNSCTVRDDVLAPLAIMMVEVELALPLVARTSSGLEYHARAVPFALMQENPTQPAVRSSQGWALSIATPRASTIGFGVKPVGLRGWIGTDVRLEAEISAGILRFGTPLLAANATRVNFTYEFGLGIRLPRLGSRGAVIGYRRHHVSNAGFGEVNPGLNSNVVFLGLPLG